RSLPGRAVAREVSVEVPNPGREVEDHDVNPVSPLRNLLLAVGIAILPLVARAAGILNTGQAFTWIAFIASLVAGISFLAAMGGRDNLLPTARMAFRLQWAAYLASAAVLWLILFRHDFSYQYVASYSSRAMPSRYIYAAFWGGQEGTFMLWALITATLALL